MVPAFVSTFEFGRRQESRPMMSTTWWKRVMSTWQVLLTSFLVSASGVPSSQGGTHSKRVLITDSSEAYLTAAQGSTTTTSTPSTSGVPSASISAPAAPSSAAPSRSNSKRLWDKVRDSVAANTLARENAREISKNARENARETHRDVRVVSSGSTNDNSDDEKERENELEKRDGNEGKSGHDSGSGKKAKRPMNVPSREEVADIIWSRVGPMVVRRPSEPCERPGWTKTETGRPVTNTARMSSEQQAIISISQQQHTSSSSMSGASLSGASPTSPVSNSVNNRVSATVAESPALNSTESPMSPFSTPRLPSKKYPVVNSNFCPFRVDEPLPKTQRSASSSRKNSEALSTETVPINTNGFVSDASPETPGQTKTALDYPSRKFSSGSYCPPSQAEALFHDAAFSSVAMISMSRQTTTDSIGVSGEKIGDNSCSSSSRNASKRSSSKRKVSSGQISSQLSGLGSGVASSSSRSSSKCNTVPTSPSHPMTPNQPTSPSQSKTILTQRKSSGGRLITRRISFSSVESGIATSSGTAGETATGGSTEEKDVSMKETGGGAGDNSSPNPNSISPRTGISDPQLPLVPFSRAAELHIRKNSFLRDAGEDVFQAAMQDALYGSNGGAEDGGDGDSMLPDTDGATTPLADGREKTVDKSVSGIDGVEKRSKSLQSSDLERKSFKTKIERTPTITRRRLSTYCGAGPLAGAGLTPLSTCQDVGRRGSSKDSVSSVSRDSVNMMTPLPPAIGSCGNSGNSIPQCATNVRPLVIPAIRRSGTRRVSGTGVVTGGIGVGTGGTGARIGSTFGDGAVGSRSPKMSSPRTSSTANTPRSTMKIQYIDIVSSLSPFGTRLDHHLRSSSMAESGNKATIITSSVVNVTDPNQESKYDKGNANKGNKGDKGDQDNTGDPGVDQVGNKDGIALNIPVDTMVDNESSDGEDSVRSCESPRGSSKRSYGFETSALETTAKNSSSETEARTLQHSTRKRVAKGYLATPRDRGDREQLPHQDQIVVMESAVSSAIPLNPFEEQLDERLERLSERTESPTPRHGAPHSVDTGGGHHQGGTISRLAVRSYQEVSDHTNNLSEHQLIVLARDVEKIEKTIPPYLAPPLADRFRRHGLLRRHTVGYTHGFTIGAGETLGTAGITGGGVVSSGIGGGGTSSGGADNLGTKSIQDSGMMMAFQPRTTEILSNYGSSLTIADMRSQRESFPREAHREALLETPRERLNSSSSRESFIPFPPAETNPRVRRKQRLASFPVFSSKIVTPFPAHN